MHWSMHWSHNAGGGWCSVGVGAGARSGRACDCRRTREPDTTLSPRLRASARLLFPGRRPIATGEPLARALLVTGTNTADGSGQGGAACVEEGTPGG